MGSYSFISVHIYKKKKPQSTCAESGVTRAPPDISGELRGVLAASYSVGLVGSPGEVTDKSSCYS